MFESKINDSYYLTDTGLIKHTRSTALRFSSSNQCEVSIHDAADSLDLDA